MEKHEREALTVFMRQVQMKLHTVKDHQYFEMNDVLERFGEESDEFQKFQSDALNCFWMERAIRVIEGSLTRV